MVYVNGIKAKPKSMLNVEGTRVSSPGCVGENRFDDIDDCALRRCTDIEKCRFFERGKQSGMYRYVSV
jgi:hypothetical protein